MTFNSPLPLVKEVFRQLSLPNIAIRKMVYEPAVPAKSFQTTVYSHVDEYFQNMSRLETELPDCIFEIHNHRDYWSPNGQLRIKCDYQYSGTFLLEKAMLYERSLQSPEKGEELSDVKNAEVPSFKVEGPKNVTKIPVLCRGTLFIYLNEENRIANLEFVCRYL